MKFLFKPNTGADCLLSCHEVFVVTLSADADAVTALAAAVAVNVVAAAHPHASLLKIFFSISFVAFCTTFFRSVSLFSSTAPLQRCHPSSQLKPFTPEVIECR